jgi:hypothetical protein
VPLFQRSFPTITVGGHTTYKVDGHNVRVARFADGEHVDLWAPFASPLRRFRRTVESFPARASFLTPDPDRVAHWKRWTGSLPGKTAGILWKSLKLDGVRLREFSPFEQWRAVLATPGVSFVNMQYGECADELEHARTAMGIDIHQPPGIDLKMDLDDVAALCSALDLIVAPANATSNIGSACGAEAWFVTGPHAWPRLGQDRYPWYPRARAFKAARFGDWLPVMQETADALAAWAATPAP